MNRILGLCLLAASITLGACSPAAETKAEAPAAAQTQAEVIATAVADQQRRFDAAPPVSTADPATAYQFEFEGLMLPRVPMNAFQGEVVLVVNTASKCGFTPQYEGLQAIYSEYHAQGFEVVGVPSNDFGGQEPGTAQEIQEFCELNFGVTFPMTAKNAVTGAQRHPFYQWAEAQLGQSAVPGWNFHKLLIGRDGRLIAAFPSDVTPTSEQIRTAITAALAA
jgi:glutathione peroxidase